MESFMYSIGTLNEKWPKESVRVPRFLLITPTLAYMTGSPVASDMTVRAEPESEQPISARLQTRGLYPIENFMSQIYKEFPNYYTAYPKFSNRR